MAKQAGFLKITGCYDNICFYKMDGGYYARLKSSLNGKRVKKDPAFCRTMEHARLLGQASAIASAVYRTMQQEKKEKGFYKKLTGQVMRLLKEGKTREEIVLQLSPVNKDVTRPAVVKTQVAASPVKNVLPARAQRINQQLLLLPAALREAQRSSIGEEDISFANELLHHVFAQERKLLPERKRIRRDSESNEQVLPAESHASRENAVACDVMISAQEDIYKSQTG